MIISKVWKNVSSNQKMVCVPRKEKDINEGDYVMITKINEKDINGVKD